MKKQGLIAVDLDGTLIDTVAVNAESYRRALESFGFTLDYDYYAAYCNGRHYRAFLQPLMGGSPSAEDVERVHDLKKQYYAANMGIARKNEALFVILEALRPTHYLAVITTGSRQNATEMLDHFHCTDWFDLILTQEDVVNNKPDPEGYLKAMAHFGVDAAHTMIFEDSATALIRMTKEAMAAHPESALHGLAVQSGGVNGRTAFDAAAQGDVAGKAVVEQYIHYLAVGVANMINIFFPEVIGLSGGVANQGENLLAPLRAAVGPMVFGNAYAQKHTRITTCTLGYRAGVIGAALLAKNQG